MEHDNLFIQILEILSIKHTEDFTIRFYESHPHKNNLFFLIRKGTYTVFLAVLFGCQFCISFKLCSEMTL